MSKTNDQISVMSILDGGVVKENEQCGWYRPDNTGLKKIYSDMGTKLESSEKKRIQVLNM
jgi:hypothetical protein